MQVAPAAELGEQDLPTFVEENPVELRDVRVALRQGEQRNLFFGALAALHGEDLRRRVLRLAGRRAVRAGAPRAGAGLEHDGGAASGARLGAHQELLVEACAHDTEVGQQAQVVLHGRLAALDDKEPQGIGVLRGQSAAPSVGARQRRRAASGASTVPLVLGAQSNHGAMRRALCGVRRFAEHQWHVDRLETHAPDDKSTISQRHTQTSMCTLITVAGGHVGHDGQTTQAQRA
mmetsp:Transcript_41785/g.116521  ORF Transcript_41785/g.116521 Transcript_41785/m.116521 type:complete len:233 (-) Transcript_41785:145-843(-)